MPEKELDKARFLRDVLRYERLLRPLLLRSARNRAAADGLLQGVYARLLSPTAAPNALPIVSAGERAEVSEAAGGVDELGADTAQARSWIQGRLWFDRVRLAEGVAEFYCYSRRQFVISDARVTHLHIGRTFATQDTLSFAVSLCSFGIRVDESDPDTLTLSEVDLHP